jgi:DHA1 family bicyclomycin/chloramphenicol resistance-like MFS transporter
MNQGPGYREFVTLLAFMISITALSIDMMLPAFTQIGKGLHVSHTNDVQLVVTVLLFGMGIGQLLFGPLADSFGRKPVIIVGFIIFIIGCLFSIFATRFELMVVGRLIQGIGTGGPRTAIIALVRDQYGGRSMARIMSVVMAIFIVVPVIAPALGTGCLVDIELAGHIRRFDVSGNRRSGLVCCQAARDAFPKQSHSLYNRSHFGWCNHGV